MANTIIIEEEIEKVEKGNEKEILDS